MCVATLITLRLALPCISQESQSPISCIARETYIYIYIYIYIREREFESPREAFAPLKVPRSGSRRRKETKSWYARKFLRRTRECDELLWQKFAKASVVLFFYRNGSRTYRANLEGSSVRHVHPAGILRPSCRSRRCPFLAGGVSTTFEGLNREGESHLLAPNRFRSRQWWRLAKRSSVDNHCRVERNDLEENTRPASLSSLWSALEQPDLTRWSAQVGKLISR